MDPNVQLDEPVALLIAVATDVTPRWLHRIVAESATRAGIDVAAEPCRTQLETAVATWSAGLIDRLGELLAVDVDEQRTNPLSLFRSAIAGPTELLVSWEVPTRKVDRFTTEHFPEDVFGLGPASWSDIDPALQEAGITWSAWKAMTVLRRRRDEGQR